METKKQFRITLFEQKILISTQTNNEDAYVGAINTQHDIKIGWHDFLETNENDLTYNECCRVLILFGISPPTYNELMTILRKPYIVQYLKNS